MSGVLDVGARVPKTLTLAQRLYLPQVLAGMRVTICRVLVSTTTASFLVRTEK